MELITTIGVACTCVLGFYFYLKGKTNFLALVEKFVIEAEKEYRGIRKMGEEKLVYVIIKVRAYLPIFFGNLITDKMIKDTVKTILDTLEEYAKYQLDKFEADKMETKEETQLETEKIAVLEETATVEKTVKRTKKTKK